MWIIKLQDEPGKDYGKYHVGYFEPIGGDHLFRSLLAYPDFQRAATAVHYLNGGGPDEYGFSGNYTAT